MFESWQAPKLNKAFAARRICDKRLAELDASMSEHIDGWRLLARIAARPDAFAGCETTARLAALLLIRTQLVQGVVHKRDFLVLASSIGEEPMAEVLNNLAGYEALRVADNVGWQAVGARSAAAARRWLIGCLQTAGDAAASQPRQSLRRHSAMGARRVRVGS
jgi:hypothetical protein